MGELDKDDPRLQGVVNDEDYILRAVQDTESARKKSHLKLSGVRDDQNADLKSDVLVRLATLATKTQRSSERVAADLKAQFPDRTREKWDVESVQSTYSNLSNHPRLLRMPVKGGANVIELDAKGFPKRAMQRLQAERRSKHAKPSARSAVEGLLYDEGGSIAEGRQEEEEQEEWGDVVNLGEKRDKNESKQDKKARKAAMKARKREERRMKKQVGLQYKHEELAVHTRNVKNPEGNVSTVRLA
jgi:protein LTV1